LHYRTLLGMSRQEQADFCWADMKRFFKVSLWDRSHTCKGCRKEIASFEDASLDHIIPRSKGGRTRLVNLQLMHRGCNSKKSSQITTRLSRSKFMKALQPADSLRGQKTRREMGMSVNGRANARG
jgi:5-methylcytosine-specific restriction endonuclease McrA